MRNIGHSNDCEEKRYQTYNWINSYKILQTLTDGKNLI